MDSIRDPKPFRYDPHTSVQHAASTSTWPSMPPLSTAASLSNPIHGSATVEKGQMQKAPKKRRRARRRPVLPMGSASSSSWGAHDPSADEGEESAPTSGSETDDEADVQEAQGSPTKSWSEDTPPPRKKRPHLAADDVGRFANMSIDLGSANVKTKESLLKSSPSPIVMKSFPQAPPSSPNLPIEPTLKQQTPLTPTSVEEPSEERGEEKMDSEMRARKGQTSFEIDKGRFYVASLSDSSSGEEGEVEDDRERSAQVDRALVSASGRPVEQHTTSSATSAEDNVVYTVNGELINRLEALEAQRRAALARDRTEARILRSRKKKGGRGSATSSGTSTPTYTSDPSPNALVLWKSPQEILDRGTSAMTFADKSYALASSTSNEPLVVTDEGDYAYVKRHDAPAPHRDNSYEGSWEQPAKVSDPSAQWKDPSNDAMDLDD